MHNVGNWWNKMPPHLQQPNRQVLGPSSLWTPTGSEERRPRILCSCWACVLLEPWSGSVEGHGDWHPQPHPDPLHAGVLAHPGHLARTLRMLHYWPDRVFIWHNLIFVLFPFLSLFSFIFIYLLHRYGILYFHPLHNVTIYYLLIEWGMWTLGAVWSRKECWIWWRSGSRTGNKG